MTLNLSCDVGIKVKNSVFEFSVDPTKYRETSDINFVTHGHRDHINLTKRCSDKTYVVTKPTMKVMQAYFGETFSYEIIDYKDKLKLDDITFKFRDSGHVYGSYMLDVISDETITITGDINTIDTTITDSCVPKETDTLVIETTYGHPDIIFPDREKVYDDFMKWLKTNLFAHKLPVITAYSFGKTQEIIGLINRDLNVDIGLIDLSYNITKVHDKHKLRNYHKLNGNIKDMDVIILPPSYVNKSTIPALEYQSKKTLALANVTGQDFGFGKNFKISSHADSQGLLNFVEASNPKQVYTYHGYDEEFAKLVTKKLGIKAKPLSKV